MKGRKKFIIGYSIMFTTIIISSISTIVALEYTDKKPNSENK